MAIFLQQVVNTLFQGSIYALFALGYTLIFGVLDILNLAHSAVFMWGAFMALLLVTKLGLNIVAAFVLAMVGSGLLGILLDRVAFAPLRARGASHLAPLISSIALGIVFQSAALGLFGGLVYRFPAGTAPSADLGGGGVHVDVLQVIIFGVAVALMVALEVLLRRTRLGKSIRAVAENQQAARLLGINVEQVIAITFALSSALGGAAGVLVGLSLNAIAPDMGQAIELKGLAVIIIGGMGSIPGAVVAGFLLAATEVFTISFISSTVRDAIAFSLLFLVLLIWPSGILGRRALREA
jgi:branched-chain amino acid transport system permease protein